ncbi:MAG: dihydrofolate reductase family protein [Nanoarchaeota archaeon]
MKITLYMAMSLNGYVAKDNDETPWSKEIWESYYKIAGKFKTIIVGRRTYQIMKEADEFEKIGNPFTVVLSEKNQVAESGLVFVRTPSEAIKVLKNKSFTEALLIGGGKVNASFIKEGFIDEIILDIEPTIFGKGIQLFAPDTYESKLQLIEFKKISSNILQLHYRTKI